ncbi:MAG TPA: LysR substrate-binding domain-containing protein, partial [Ramlibacter sp.]|nr:LysR substrate-binding domain-containing protein [Ramlibacter sp.]
FLAEVRGLVDQLDRSVASLQDAADLEVGDVTIGCVFSAVHHFLPPVIRAFRAQHPGVLVRIVEEGADEVLEAVKLGDADFALNYIGMQDPEVDFMPLLKEPYVLACPAGHALARRRSVAWSELAEYPHARVSHASRNRLFIDQALADLPPLPRPVCEVRHVSTLVGLVENGLGVAVVPQLALPVGSAAVVGVRLGEPAVTRTIGLTRRSGRTLSPAAEAFSHLLVQASKAKRASKSRLSPRA